MHYKLILSIFLSLLCASGLVGQGSAFIKNQGQWDASVSHRFPLNNGDLWLDEGGWSLSVMHAEQREEALHALHGEIGASTLVQGHVLKVRLKESQKPDNIQNSEERSAYHNYFIGNDKSKWQGHVPLFDRVRFSHIYAGIDLEVESENGRPKMTYIVDPQVDPSTIQLEYQGHRGLSVKEGELHIKTSIGTILETGLMAYQLLDGVQTPVKCQFKLSRDLVTFKLGVYNKNEVLYIDPTVIASTNSGCTSEAFGHTATFNEASQIYSAGRCFGTGYPTDTGAFQVNFGGPFSGNYYLMVDMCLSKYNQDGSELIYATYLGGNAEDLPHSMIANEQDQIVLLGSSNSTNYPVSTGAYDQTHNGGKDIVITSLSSDGSQLIGSTYIGGSGLDGVNGIEEYYADDYRGEVVLDTSGNIYIASFTKSANFPATAGSFQDSLSGGQDGVICKLTPSLDTLIWATMIGGSLDDAAFALKLDQDENVFVAGVTKSSTYPMAGNSAFGTYLGGQTDAFVSKLSPDGAQLLASSFYGTASGDQNFFVELDQDGAVYLFGTTAGTIAATTGKYVGPSDGAYVYKTTSDLDTIEWVTTFGDLAPAAFLVDNCNRIYISGQGATATVLNINNFDTLDPVNNLVQAGFYLMKLSPDAASLEFGSFYGNSGSHVDGGTSRFDKRGVVYQATCSNGVFPTTSWAYSTTNQTNGSTYDNTVFKIDFESNVAFAAITPGDSACAPYLAEFDNTGSEGNVHYWWFGDGTFTTDSTPTHLYDSVGVYNIFYVITDSAGCYGYDTAFLDLTIVAAIYPEIMIGDTLCVDSVSLSVDTSMFQAYNWSTGENTATIYAFNEGTYIVTATANLFCEHADTIHLSFQEAYHFTLNDTGICELNFPIFGPDGAVNYAWSTGDSTQNTIATETGEYTLTASNGECEQVETMQVNVSYVRFATDDTSTCFESLELEIQEDGGNVLWSTNETTPVITVSQSGVYWVTISNGFCISSDTIDVEFDPQMIDLGNDTVVCGPFVIELDSSFDTYLWRGGNNGNSIYIDSTVNLWVKVGDGECTDEDTLRVVVENLAFNTDDIAVCDADSGLLIAPGPKRASYYWSTGDTLNQAWVFAPGNYWVDVRTEHCQKVDSVLVRFVTTPSFSLGPDTSMCVGETLSVPLDTMYSQTVWSTGDTGTSITLKQSGEIWAAQTFDGCIRFDTISIKLRRLFSDSFSFINNVMTPNGDGLNDELKYYIEDESLILSFNLIVYDRWGLKVFETDEIGAYWDGIRPSGKPADDGTFFYLMEVETVCVQRPLIEVKDNVTLVK